MRAISSVAKDTVQIENVLWFLQSPSSINQKARALGVSKESMSLHRHLTLPGYEHFSKLCQPRMAYRMKTVCLIRSIIPHIKPPMNIDWTGKRSKQSMLIVRISALFHAMSNLQMGISSMFQQQTAITQDTAYNHFFLLCGHVRQRQTIDITRMVFATAKLLNIGTLTLNAAIDVLSRLHFRSASLSPLFHREHKVQAAENLDMQKSNTGLSCGARQQR